MPCKFFQLLHLNNRELGGISSYAFDLLVVYFLQQKNYIPVLHEVGTRLPCHHVADI